jgi:hypothetical protein
MVKGGKEKTFTKPMAPRTREGWSIFHGESKEYITAKALLVVVDLGQSFVYSDLRSNLENENEFSSMEEADEVVGSLKASEVLAFWIEAVEHPFMTLQEVPGRLTNVSQYAE